mgnify:CR=1 FL=1
MTVADATPDFEEVDRTDRAFLGHPKGLGYLGFTEACERFSYYSMQTLLVLYMVNYLLTPERMEGVLDISEFFGETTGGVRTYLLEKARYVQRNPLLRQVLVVPGAVAMVLLVAVASAAAALMATQNGASLLRVHDVAETVDALAVLNAVRSAV